MNQMMKNTLSLFTITAVTGLLLGAVYEGTREARASQAEKTQKQAYQSVFDQADDFKEVEADALEQAVSKIDYTSKEVVVDKAVQALDAQGERLGYVITVTAKEGYGGDIQFTVGIDNENRVTGLSYLSISETPGLGMKAKEESFMSQYTGKSTKEDGNFIVNKDGNDGCVIDAISGATITSRAVTKGVNAASGIAQTLLEGGAVDE